MVKGKLSLLEELLTASKERVEELRRAAEVPRYGGTSRAWEGRFKKAAPATTDPKLIARQEDMKKRIAKSETAKSNREEVWTKMGIPTEEAARQMRDLSAHGFTYKEIGEMYGVTGSYAGLLVTNYQMPRNYRRKRKSDAKG